VNGTRSTSRPLLAGVALVIVAASVPLHAQQRDYAGQLLRVTPPTAVAEVRRGNVFVPLARGAFVREQDCIRVTRPGATAYIRQDDDSPLWIRFNGFNCTVVTVRSTRHSATWRYVIDALRPLFRSPAPRPVQGGGRDLAPHLPGLNDHTASVSLSAGSRDLFVTWCEPRTLRLELRDAADRLVRGVSVMERVTGTELPSVLLLPGRYELAIFRLGGDRLDTIALDVEASPTGPSAPREPGPASLHAYRRAADQVSGGSSRRFEAMQSILETIDATDRSAMAESLFCAD
jgi:hypothetical protein